MTFVPEKSITSLFKKLNSPPIQYILLRNISNELPSKLTPGKDIDILARYSDRSELISFFRNLNFKHVRHPNFADVFLYGVNYFDFFSHPDGYFVDINYQIVCRSLNQREWIPLDRKIQTTGWNCRIFDEGETLPAYRLSPEIEFISLIARCIFDKQHFPSGYQSRINSLLTQVSLCSIVVDLKLVFFGFTERLLDMIQKQQYSDVFQEYLTFYSY
jgi:hypothetical protein